MFYSEKYPDTSICPSEPLDTCQRDTLHVSMKLNLKSTFQRPIVDVLWIKGYM